MSKTDFEIIVDEHYEKLYRFAMSLVNDTVLASDLTQQTFYIYACKSGQIRDRSRTKSWLFTTLHREFIALKRKESRHPQYEIHLVEDDLPSVDPSALRNVDVQWMLQALDRIEDRYRIPLVMYHIEDFSYREIAEMLDIPIGTVMSRLSRGRDCLFRLMHAGRADSGSKVIEMPRKTAVQAHRST